MAKQVSGKSTLRGGEQKLREREVHTEFEEKLEEASVPGARG